MKTMSDTPEEMPDNATDQPLVIFAQFAYNQEQFIREAVEGACAKTYEPLEIIPSDECSTDRTFKFIQEMADAYAGPHRFIVRRNTINLGTTLNTNMASTEARGKLFVVGSDDTSKPNRMSFLVNTWTGAGRPKDAVHAGRETFRKGQIIAVEPATHRFSNRLLEGFAQSYWMHAAALTCAYTRGVFERFAPMLGGSIISHLYPAIGWPIVRI
jgi:hypothetical protein